MSALTQRKSGSLSREHFMLRELRIVARLLLDGVSEGELIAKASADNIFQYPTTHEASRVARSMLVRLHAVAGTELESANPLLRAVAEGTKAQAAQINLYAMMRVYALIAAFMVQEVASRLRSLDYTLTRADVNGFLARYQANVVQSAFSQSTERRIAGVLFEALSETGFRADSTSDDLRPVLLDPVLEQAMVSQGRAAWVSVFTGAEVLV